MIAELTPSEKVLLAIEMARSLGFDKTIHDFQSCLVMHEDYCAATQDGSPQYCTCDMCVVLESDERSVMLLSDGQVLPEQ